MIFRTPKCMRGLVCCLLLGSFSVVGCSEPVTQNNNESQNTSTYPTNENRLPGQYIVTLKEGANADVLKQVFQSYGIKSMRDLSRGRYLVILEQDPGPEEMTKQTANSSEIEDVQPNYIYRTMPPAQEKPLLQR